MPWLARLDAHARRWPMPLRWAYVALRWYLVAAGAFLLANLYLHRLGLPSLWPD